MARRDVHFAGCTFRMTVTQAQVRRKEQKGRGQISLLSSRSNRHSSILQLLSVASLPAIQSPASSIESSTSRWRLSSRLSAGARPRTGYVVLFDLFDFLPLYPVSRRDIAGLLDRTAVGSETIATERRRLTVGYRVACAGHLCYGRLPYRGGHSEHPPGHGEGWIW